jgi:hypothetical protein
MRGSPITKPGERFGPCVFSCVHPYPIDFVYLQHYLRVQTSSGKSYDVMSQLCKYFVCLEQFVTEGSLREMIQCVDTLTETIQGPCRENQAVVLDNKVLDAAMRVLAWSPADLEVSSRDSDVRQLVLSDCFRSFMASSRQESSLITETSANSIVPSLTW